MSPVPHERTIPAPDALSGLLHELARAPEPGEAVWPTPGERLGDRYQTVRVLGRGGFGVVLEARDAVLGRPVAVKVFRPGRGGGGGAVDPSLLAEAEAIARLSHPNIVQIHDRASCPSGPFLVLELLEGEPLSRRIERGPLPAAEATRIGLAVARALAHAHVRGVVHRDLKPSNVLVCFDGQVKVLDFGLAYLVGRVRNVEGGTPGWMAPEQRRGAPGDERTDVWALGAILFRALSGPSPADPRLSVPEAPDLEALVEAMLSEDPAGRPRDATRVVEALEPIARRLEAGRASLPERAPARRDRLGAGVLLVAGVTLAVALALALGSARLRSGEPAPSARENALAEARYQKLTDFEGVEGAAAISRDGRFVAFLSDRDGPLDVWVTQVGTGRFLNLTRGRAPELSNPSLRTLGFSPEGSLVTYWARQPPGTGKPDISVWAAPLLGGPPRPYLEGIAEYDWSSDARRLVFHTPGPGDPMSVSDSGETSGARQIFSAPEGQHGHFLLWSPDQEFVYFVQGSLPEPMDVWRIRPGGGAPERLTRHDAIVTHPVFLDARTLLYLATDRDGFGPYIHSLDVERGTSRRVSGGIDVYTSLAGSADGRRLVATVANPKATLWRVPLAGGRADMSSAKRIPLTTGNATFARLGPGYLLYVSSTGAKDSLWKLQGDTSMEIWSGADSRIIGAPAIRRDGGRIAFSVHHGERTALWVVNQDGTEAQAVTGALELRGAPAWSPDGRSITVAAMSEGMPRLFQVPVEGSAPARLVGEPSTDPVWSSDGELLAYSGPDVGTKFPVRAVRPDGSPYPTPALTLTRGARHVAFLPTGRTLLVLRGDLRHKDLWQVDLDGGDAHAVTALGQDFEIRDYDVSPDGRELVLEQVQMNSDVVLIELPGR